MAALLVCLPVMWYCMSVWLTGCGQSVQDYGVWEAEDIARMEEARREQQAAKKNGRGGKVRCRNVQGVQGQSACAALLAVSDPLASWR